MTGELASPAETIAVIIPTIGDRDMTELRDALSRQTRPADELIVIEDRTRRGGGWARNRGIERSSASILVFLDDDCIPPPEWLDSLVTAIQSLGAAGAGGTYDEDDPFLHARRLRQKYPSKVQIDTAGLVGAGGNVAYRRSVFEQLYARDGHWFNEAFRVAEDKELAWRIRSRGGRLVFVPSNVRHTKRSAGWAYIRLQFGRGIGIAGLYCVARAAREAAPPDRGMLWASRGESAMAKWLRILAMKAFGPFDRKSFQSTAHYLLFWIGEKSQGLGFIWGLLWRPFLRGRGQP